MFSEGDLILGKYRILMPIGVGGMGLVFKARHEELGRQVALKVLRPHLRANPEIVDRFRREARVMASVKSPHVLEVFDVQELEDRTPMLVTELLRGCDLRTELAERGQMPVDDAVNYLLQACEGIAAIHKAGYVHRDLKPQNLFITAGSKGEPVLKVLDFGIAKSLADDDGLSTSTQSSFGTPRYMSPEQIRSAKLTDVRSDVWSLGVILFELLTGRLPFQADSPAGWAAAILTDAPTPLRELRPEVSESLEQAVAQALQKQPDARWQSADEFRRVLRSFGVASQPSLVEPRPRLLRSLPPILLPVELRAPVLSLAPEPTAPAVRRRPAGGDAISENVETPAPVRLSAAVKLAVEGPAPPRAARGRTRSIVAAIVGLCVCVAMALSWLATPDEQGTVAPKEERLAPVHGRAPAQLRATVTTPAAASASPPESTLPAAQTVAPVAPSPVRELPKRRRPRALPDVESAKTPTAAASAADPGLPLHL